MEKTVSDSCVAVAPVRVAAGIQNKVLVAMANGLPVIMTSLISKAIPETQKYILVYTWADEIYSESENDDEIQDL